MNNLEQHLMEQQNFEQFLMEKYPTLHPKDDDGVTLPPSCETSCPAGWKPLVDNLCECISDYVRTYRTSKLQQPDGPYTKIYPNPVTIDQIKSKFGTLRFYYTGGDDTVSGMVRFAEHLSGKTCEATGKPGKLDTSGRWWVTRAI